MRPETVLTDRRASGRVPSSTVEVAGAAVDQVRTAESSVTEAMRVELGCTGAGTTYVAW